MSAAWGAFLSHGVFLVRLEVRIICQRGSHVRFTCAPLFVPSCESGISEGTSSTVVALRTFLFLRMYIFCRHGDEDTSSVKRG